jgi:hypothetical protein
MRVPSSADSGGPRRLGGNGGGPVRDGDGGSDALGGALGASGRTLPFRLLEGRGGTKTGRAAGGSDGRSSTSDFAAGGGLEGSSPMGDFHERYARG